MSRARTVAEGWVPLRHGTTSSYTRGCRCDLCRQHNTNRYRLNGAVKRNRDKNLAKRVVVDGRLISPVPDEQHGKPGTYTRFGCRCDLCKLARSRYVAEWKRRKRGAA